MRVELLSSMADTLDSLVGMLVLPFWLWGVLLGLATWSTRGGANHVRGPRVTVLTIRPY